MLKQSLFCYPQAVLLLLLVCSSFASVLPAEKRDDSYQFSAGGGLEVLKRTFQSLVNTFIFFSGGTDDMKT